MKKISSMRKGQVETFGLVIIVILIIFVAVFALQFMVKPKKSLDGDYLKIQANNLRNSVLKYTLCNNVDIKQELYNCQELGFNECTDCNELENIIKDIMEKSLDEKTGYGFNVGAINILEGSCTDKIYATSERFINSDLKAELYLC